MKSEVLLENLMDSEKIKAFDKYLHFDYYEHSVPQREESSFLLLLDKSAVSSDIEALLYLLERMEYEEDVEYWYKNS